MADSGGWWGLVKSGLSAFTNALDAYQKEKAS